MGFFSKVTSSVMGGLGLDKAADFVGGTLLGGDAKDAARDAARTQAQALDKGIELQRETRDIARKDLAPFRDFGAGQINPLLSLLTPQGQADYVQTNPLFEAALESVNNATMANQAARGKLGSGGTIDAITDNFMATALPYISDQRNALFNAVNMGQSSAAGQANTSLTTANTIGDLYGQQGAVNAAGIVGAQGAKQAGINNLLNLGGQLGAAYLTGGASAAASPLFSGGMGGFSDRRLKRDIEKIGEDEHGNLYKFKYVNHDQEYVGRMADELNEIHPEAVTVHESGYLQVTEPFQARAV